MLSKHGRGCPAERSFASCPQTFRPPQSLAITVNGPQAKDTHTVEAVVPAGVTVKAVRLEVLADGLRRHYLLRLLLPPNDAAHRRHGTRDIPASCCPETMNAVAPFAAALPVPCVRTQKQGGGLRTLIHKLVQSRLFQTK
jgi:hypothetical protein